MTLSLHICISRLNRAHFVIGPGSLLLSPAVPARPTPSASPNQSQTINHASPSRHLKNEPDRVTESALQVSSTQALVAIQHHSFAESR